jgi:hypothetical protein
LNLPRQPQRPSIDAPDRADWLTRVGWYRRRLVAMSAAELAHRAVEQQRRIVSRWWAPDFPTRLGGNRFVVPAMPWLIEGVRRIGDDAALITAWRSLAVDVCAGRFRLFDKTWPATALPDWHLDPETGRRWPSDLYCFDIAYRHATGVGDVKYAWELSRLQYLQPIAALAALTGDAALARLCAQHIESWVDANPPFQGIHWASMIELAHRIVSILVVTGLLGEATFDQHLTAKIGASLAAHGWWIERFPSRFSSANNHCIAEAAGLFLLGALAPGLERAPRWEAAGRRVLEQEAERQFHADGVPGEQSPSYGAFSLEWLALCGRVAATVGRPFSVAFWQRLEAVGDFLRAVTDAGGHQPVIGDDDGSHVLASGFGEGAYISSVLAALAAVMRKPEIAPPRPAPHLREAVFGRVDPAASPAGVRHYPRGGYTLVRENGDAREVLWLMDHGPLGYLSIAAHGHADALSLWLHLGGRPILVDAGTYRYYGNKAWRDHFRSTAAHNTLTIDGADSSRMAGPFNWSSRASVTVREIKSDVERWIIDAEHDGYRSMFGLVHRRRLERLGAGKYLLSDRLVGVGPPVPVEIGFLFHPALTLRLDGAAWVVHAGETAILRIQHRGGLPGIVQRGQEMPRRGWYSDAFGRKQPAPRLCFSGMLAPGTMAETLFEVPD